MTPQETLDAHRSLVAVNSEKIALELSAKLRARTIDEQRLCFGGDYKSGFFWLFRDDSHPDKVMETVVSPLGDAITSVYVNCSFNGSIGNLMNARHSLIAAIAEKVGLSVEAMGVEDRGRGRSLNLAELSTGQLIDLLADQMGASLMTTASVGGDVNTAAVLR